MVALPKRSSRYGIGKEIGGAVYLHRDYEHLAGADPAGEGQNIRRLRLHRRQIQLSHGQRYVRRLTGLRHQS